MFFHVDLISKTEIKGIQSLLQDVFEFANCKISRVGGEKKNYYVFLHLTETKKASYDALFYTILKLSNKCNPFGFYLRSI